MKAEWKTQKLVDVVVILVCVGALSVSIVEIVNRGSWVYLFFAVLSLIWIGVTCRFVYDKMVLETEVSYDLERLGYKKLLDGISRIQHAIGVGFLGFFLGGKYYSVSGVAGEYKVKTIPHGDKVTYYIYEFFDTDWSMIAVVESNHPIKIGDVMVFCK